MHLIYAFIKFAPSEFDYHALLSCGCYDDAQQYQVVGFLFKSVVSVVAMAPLHNKAQYVSCVGLCSQLPVTVMSTFSFVLQVVNAWSKFRRIEREI